MPDQHVSMNLLIFSLNGSRYGLDAEQIVEMVEHQDEEKLDRASSGSHGVLRRGEEIPVVELAERIGLKGPVTYTAPKIVLPRADEMRMGFLIEDPQEMAPIAVEDIYLLPDLVKRLGAGAGIWGVARRADHLIILVDLMEAGDVDGAMT